MGLDCLLPSTPNLSSVSVSGGGTESSRGRKSPSPVWAAPSRKRSQTLGSVAELGMWSEGKKESRIDRHPALGCEVGRTWLQLRESRLKGGSRKAGGAWCLHASLAQPNCCLLFVTGLERLTHMVLCSVPAPCLNPYAAGRKVPLSPLLFPPCSSTRTLPTLSQLTGEVLGGKALQACTSLLPLNPSELLSPLSLQSATTALVLCPSPSSPPSRSPFIFSSLFGTR